ncbi:uncharacterized protein DC041_0001906 [Schistosoma bovis]|uniref:DUF389 domain-containing protein n=1 Tax=Schistosoma bovis TaxID=6184 RepID=A0A430QMQ1_SCHBO|nr:uncharacterized protein DC041_0001906 [Schistosoma bovis]
MACLIRTVFPRKVDDSNGLCSPNVDANMPLEEIPMEESVRNILTEEQIYDDEWSISRNKLYFIVSCNKMYNVYSTNYNNGSKRKFIFDILLFYFRVTEPTINVQKRNKGEKSGVISYSAIQNFIGTLKSRLCVAQVYNEINQRGSFDMNYLCFLLCAAIVANIALVTNSAGVVFASMLLSPLMDPIMCILFGLNLRDRNMTTKGIRNTSISLIICVMIGLTFGYVAHAISAFQDVTPYPTSEMVQRGELRSFIGSMLVAAFSGVSVSFAILSKRLSALIGNAISLSLLPPAVNCGHLLLLSLLAISTGEKREYETTTDVESNVTATLHYCTYPWIRQYEFIYMRNHCNAPLEFLYVGLSSFCLVTMNIMLILVTGYTVNKEVRENYKCLHKFDAAGLATYAYNEYLRLNKINTHDDELTNLDIEDADQIANDFHTIMKDLKKDPYLQTITAETTQGDNSFLKRFMEKSDELSSRNAVKRVKKRHTFCYPDKKSMVSQDEAVSNNINSTTNINKTINITSRPTFANKHTNSNTCHNLENRSNNNVTRVKLVSEIRPSSFANEGTASSSTGRFEVVSVECQSESTYDPEQDDKGENNTMLRRNV